jgi:hypothetical protein
MMTDFGEAAAAAATPGMDREYQLDESGTLEYLLDVCQDAALGARLAAEIFAYHTELASYFEEVAAERDGFATQLALLLSRQGHADEIEAGGTFRGQLFHWRLQLAKHVQRGYREVDDRRANLRIIASGSDWVLNAYEKAEGHQLGGEAQEEVHRQAERIRASNARIHQLAESRDYWRPRE